MDGGTEIRQCCDTHRRGCACAVLRVPLHTITLYHVSVSQRFASSPCLRFFFVRGDVMRRLSHIAADTRRRAPRISNGPPRADGFS